MPVHAQSNQTSTLGNGLMIQQNAANIPSGRIFEH